MFEIVEIEKKKMIVEKCLRFNDQTDRWISNISFQNLNYKLENLI